MNSPVDDFEEWRAMQKRSDNRRGDMIYYLVCSIKKEIAVTSIFGKSNIKVSWADGMIGVLPVFDTQENAKKYADGSAAAIVEIAEIEPVTGEVER